MNVDAAKQLDWHLPLNDEKCVYMSFGEDTTNAFAVHGFRRFTDDSANVPPYYSHGLPYTLWGLPILEYANQVVYTGRKEDVTLIERIQRAATKIIAGLKFGDYETRLTVLGLPPPRVSLPLRRPTTYLCLVLKRFFRFFTVGPTNTQWEMVRRWWQRCSGEDKPHMQGAPKVCRAISASFRNRRQRRSSELHTQVTNSELDWVRRAETSGKAARVDLNIGECCEIVNLQLHSSKVVSLIVDTVVAQRSFGNKPGIKSIQNHKSLKSFSVKDNGSAFGVPFGLYADSTLPDRPEFIRGIKGISGGCASMSSQGICFCSHPPTP
ncbi:hypothetical protein CLF_110905 [Clonorchis sinensis]|uniref:Uncharacterized protein n=1 Tax=Clonorchis sinensis TaxID=79923 RepID=G7YL96_CLOSI|nr:hypothetical protein CLF_110905 [Clonorchis sinensis]